ncbi:cytochrome c-type biogenesis protein CcsB [Leifsonia sp. 98AMF]|uniref:c-type cytochrome biogenesis protein CcsB n=1 Tax=unclassified Leifsonia TaxID=2663824 RepID=UPI0008799E1B|nr:MULTISPECIES: c-type cytochrome biogenesis protein CcsB [unclassified Leifsonia]SDH02182.1 cytochrome c-type biogenesis protein CcsB [Leifsonia sp. 197AMF]SDJ39257.1 cytochrome c-type biogenesis protein CcsB [Leifsonia sp. 466MF]SDK39334.1 cytochrome c-type biogenesis protein CcsB [Leifsonia sp. 157MF]SDN59530.1 cytochrome c-type biogenesis protein CcsB [Leifsonia sp. 509MF]SEN49777.1 cytochrome c-type biogenesis protein CcsB [Leifsonia sp. 467MF]
MIETLAQLSTVFLYAAMGLYAAAFIAFALDLARRGARATAVEAAVVPSAVARRAEVAAPVGAPTTTVIGGGGGASDAPPEPSSALGRLSSRISSRVEDDLVNGSANSVSMRWAFALTIIGFAFHLVAVVLRGIAAARVPWANMWEFSMTGTLVIIGVFLVANLKWQIKYVGTFVLGLVLVLQGIALLRYYVPVVPLQPALQSYWLVIHIIVAVLGTAFFALGFALSGLQLLQYRRERQVAESRPQQFRFLATLPSSVALENLAYRINIVGFIAWTFTLIAGAIWAEKAWGRYWGWDTKEVWTFIIWVIYAGYIHARATRGWRGSRSAWLAIIGFAAVLFNFGIVNVFFHGLHAYSGL